MVGCSKKAIHMYMYMYMYTECVCNLYDSMSLPLGYMSRTSRIL